MLIAKPHFLERWFFERNFYEVKSNVRDEKMYFPFTPLLYLKDKQVIPIVAIGVANVVNIALHFTLINGLDFGYR